MSTRTNTVSALFVTAMLVVPGSLAANLYRYTNSQGVTVVDYQVPVEYVSKGYEILNTEGMVVRVVPRELTEEEKKVRNAQQ